MKQFLKERKFKIIASRLHNVDDYAYRLKRATYNAPILKAIKNLENQRGSPLYFRPKDIAELDNQIKGLQKRLMR